MFHGEKKVRKGMDRERRWDGGKRGGIQVRDDSGKADKTKLGCGLDRQAEEHVSGVSGESRQD